MAVDKNQNKPSSSKSQEDQVFDEEMSQQSTPSTNNQPPPNEAWSTISISMPTATKKEWETVFQKNGFKDWPTFFAELGNQYFDSLQQGGNQSSENDRPRITSYSANSLAYTDFNNEKKGTSNWWKWILWGVFFAFLIALGIFLYHKWKDGHKSNNSPIAPSVPKVAVSPKAVATQKKITFNDF